MSKEDTKISTLVFSSAGQLDEIVKADIEKVISQETQPLRVISISTTATVVETTSNLHVTVGYSARVNGVGGIPLRIGVLAGAELTGYYFRLYLTPPSGDEEQILSLTASELFGREPSVGDSDIPFYFFTEERTFTREKDIFPLRPTEGIYKVRLESLSIIAKHGHTTIYLEPTIVIVADGITKVDVGFPATSVNEIMPIDESWNFEH